MVLFSIIYGRKFLQRLFQGATTGKPLHYKDCMFHRVVRNFMIQERMKFFQYTRTVFRRFSEYFLSYSRVVISLNILAVEVNQSMEVFSKTKILIVNMIVLIFYQWPTEERTQMEVSSL